jgi:hypothetical protein
MGEAEILPNNNVLVIHAEMIIYGDAANEDLSLQIAADIENYWNAAAGKVIINTGWFAKKHVDVKFSIKGSCNLHLTPDMVFENTNPRNNYFRVEEFARGNISFVDGLNCNTGYFKLENLLHNSTTAAHEFGHTLGLEHPHDLDIRGKGIPGIMYPRGTLVDPHFQYVHDATPGEKGGTLNPFTRKVLQKDIDGLELHKLRFNKAGFAVIGDFSSIWHEKHLPANV